jgi:hypothetical protein
VLTVIDEVVAPFDHKYAVPLLAVSITLPPLQNVVAPFGVMVGTGADPTLTDVADEVAEQPEL